MIMGKGWVLSAAGVAIAALVPLAGGSYLLQSASLTLVYVVAALGLHLLMGVNGQMSLGHGAFIAVGAFTSALLFTRAGWPYLLTLPVAGAAAGALGYLMALPMVRLKGVYLALATLGFGLAVPDLLQRWRSLTGGSTGMRVAPFHLGGQVVGAAVKYYLVLLFAVLLAWLMQAITRTRIGRALSAVRDSELGSLASGINVAGHKHLAFVIAAVYAGLAGALYSQVVGHVAALNFNVMLSLTLVAALAIGGLGRSEGAVLGTVFLTAMEEFFRQTAGLGSILTGLLIILTSFFLRRGLAGLIADSRKRINGRSGERVAR